MKYNFLLTKILVKIDGYSGEELSEILYEDFDIEDEKTNSKSTLLLCGLGTDKKKIKRGNKLIMAIYIIFLYNYL